MDVVTLKKNIVGLIDDLDEDVLKIVYNDVHAKQISQLTSKIDKTTVIYTAALNFVNVILGNLNRPQITDLVNFKKIPREELMQEVNKASLCYLQAQLFPPFDKKKCGIYKKTDGMVINALRGMCKTIGLKLCSGIKSNTTNHSRELNTIYSIVP